MGLIVQKHVTIELPIFDKNALANLPSWPTYPIFPLSIFFLEIIDFLQIIFDGL